jgi:uncharacterized protein YdaU (DUF1376 family)
MSKNPWFKCYPANFLDGVAELEPDQGWVYTILLMRMYSEGGPIPDKPEAIAKRCNMSKARCERVIQSLVEIDKIERIDGVILNKRAQEEIKKIEKYSQKQSEISQEGWKKRSEKANENNDGDEAPLTGRKANAKPIEARSQNIEEDRENARAKADLFEAPPKRKSKLPPDCPTAKDRQKAVEYWDGKGRQDLSEDVQTVVDEFRARQERDQTTYLDWSAAWRTWYVRQPTFRRVPFQQKGIASEAAAASQAEGRDPATFTLDDWRARVSVALDDGPWPESYGHHPKTAKTQNVETLARWYYAQLHGETEKVA